MKYQIMLFLLLKTDKTGCVYVVCYLHIVDIHPVGGVEVCATVNI